MITIYNYDDYRPLFRTEVIARKRTDKRVNFNRLATHLKMQSPFLSKILSESAHMSADQIYLTADFFGYDQTKRYYVELLHSYQTCHLKKRKAELLQAIRTLQSNNLRTERHLITEAVRPSESNVRNYYLNPWIQIIHACLSCQRYRTDLDSLSRDLMLPRDRITESVSALETMGLIVIDNDGIKENRRDMHLPKDAPEYSAWLSNVRVLGLQRQHTSRDHSYGFTVFFSADDRTKKAIKQLFLKFLEEVEPLVKNADEKHVYQMNFDLIPWV
jgi:uncharacterized protein (TIGR02147 family)